jgi:hypothetical protein
MTAQQNSLSRTVPISLQPQAMISIVPRGSNVGDQARIELITHCE